MRIYENGTYRDATEAEIAAAESVVEPDEKQTLEQRLAELEQELEATKILLGVSE
jgi:tetrahydromethanopterin S-methyltransferase subunit G